MRLRAAIQDLWHRFATGDLQVWHRFVTGSLQVWHRHPASEPRKTPVEKRCHTGNHGLEGRATNWAAAFACLFMLPGILTPPAAAQVAVRGRIVHTVSGAPINTGTVVITDGKIAAVGPSGAITIPDGYRILDAEVVTPGLIDAHSTVGLTGILNIPHDQDQLERSNPIQPDLRAIDAYNTREELIGWIRSFGVTTIHTGHAPGELISGQTMIVKTTGDTVADAVINPSFALAATLGPLAQKKEDDKSPGTRGKMMAMLRQALINAQEYQRKRDAAELDKRPTRDLKLEVLLDVLGGKMPLMVTAQRAQDIDSALRLAAEFKLRVILDGAAESYLLLDEIKAAGVPVITHPSMIRAVREAENASFETPSKLLGAGIPFAFQSGYESYVPKTRVVLFEAAIAAANGLTFEQTLRGLTIDAARILGIDGRVGTIEVGKDGDLALYDSDPFEYTSHCIGVIIDGKVVNDAPR